MRKNRAFGVIGSILLCSSFVALPACSGDEGEASQGGTGLGGSSGEKAGGSGGGEAGNSGIGKAGSSGVGEAGNSGGEAGSSGSGEVGGSGGWETGGSGGGEVGGSGGGETVGPPVWRRLRFVVDPIMMQGRSLDEVGQDMVGYVDDLNAIYSSTRRRFEFDPAHDIDSFVMHDSDFSGSCVPFQPDFSYAAYLTWQRANGGGCDIHGTSEFWVMSAVNPRIMSQAEVNASSDNLRDYMSQVVTLAHELGHSHGLVDYYRLRNLVDATGIEPDLSIGSLHGHSIEASNHYYWSKRTNVLADPMFAHVADPAFCLLSQAIINFNESDDFLTQCPLGAPMCLWRPGYDFGDMQVTLKVTSQNNQELVGCSVKTYIQPTALSGVAQPPNLIVQGQTDGKGMFSVDLKGHLTQARESFVALFKVACDGYVPGGDAVSIHDIHARQVLPDQGDPDGFHVDDPIRITLATAP